MQAGPHCCEGSSASRCSADYFFVLVFTNKVPQAFVPSNSGQGEVKHSKMTVQSISSLLGHISMELDRVSSRVPKQLVYVIARHLQAWKGLGE